MLRLKIIICLFMFLFTFPVYAADEFWVQPIGVSGGDDSGTSYINAFDGLENVAWGTEEGEVGPSDKLWVCGTYIRLWNESGPVQGLSIRVQSGTSYSVRTTVSGKCVNGAGTADPGIIWGGYIDIYNTWSDEGGGVWSLTLKARIPGNVGEHVWEDISGSTGTWLNMALTQLVFTSGGIAEIEVYDYIVGVTSGVKIRVASVSLDSGAWADGTAAGTITGEADGIFLDGEDCNQSTGQDNILTVNGNSLDTTLIYLTANAGSFYTVFRDYNTPIYVHTSDGLDPTGRIMFPDYGYNIYEGASEYVTLEDLTFRLVQHTPTIGNIRYLRLDSQYSGYYNIRPTNLSDDVEILECELGFAGNGIYTGSNDSDAADRLIVRGNYIHDIGSVLSQANSDSHAIGIQGGNGHIIEFNNMVNVGTGPVTYAYYPQEMNRMKIRWNKITNTLLLGGANSWGIVLFGDNAAYLSMEDNEVYGNFIDDTAVGMRILLPDEVKVFNNTIMVSSDKGIGMSRSNSLLKITGGGEALLSLSQGDHVIGDISGAEVIAVSIRLTGSAPDAIAEFTYSPIGGNFNIGEGVKVSGVSVGIVAIDTKQGPKVTLRNNIIYDALGLFIHFAAGGGTAGYGWIDSKYANYYFDDGGDNYGAGGSYKTFAEWQGTTTEPPSDRDTVGTTNDVDPALNSDGTPDGTVTLVGEDQGSYLLPACSSVWPTGPGQGGGIILLDPDIWGWPKGFCINVKPTYSGVSF